MCIRDRERVKARFADDGGRVVEIRAGDPAAHLAKLREVQRLMDADMGFAPGARDETVGILGRGVVSSGGGGGGGSDSVGGLFCARVGGRGADSVAGMAVPGRNKGAAPAAGAAAAAAAGSATAACTTAFTAFLYVRNKRVCLLYTSPSPRD